MNHFVESIKIQNGNICNTSWHNLRLNKTRQELFNTTETLDISDYILLPENLKNQEIVKCRIIYSEKILAVEYDTYRKRIINSLKIVKSRNIDYSYKYANRSALDELFQQRGNCDDILISKDGFLTDSFAANIVLLNNEGILITPKQCLLPGTSRARLLQKGRIMEKDVKTESVITDYQKVFLINAMVDFGDWEIDIANVSE